MMKTPRAPLRLLAVLLVPLVALAACGDDDDGATADDGEPVTVTLVTHDSFDISDEVLEQFRTDSGIEVEVLMSGDAGSMVNQAILTKDDPQGDVLFGIDNNLLSRAFDEEIFLPHESPALDRVPEDVQLDDEHRVTPINTGDVCLNYDVAGLQERGLAPPASLEDLADPAYAGTLVVENPATSSPGLAFLLATVEEFGEDGWQEYWQRLVDNDVEVASGWEEAYYGSFSGSAGSEGDRPIVVSYATSPPAEVVYAEEPVEEAPTAVVPESCYRQIEFAGVLRGTEHEPEARALVDFLLSDAFQSDIPLKMFVHPVVDVELPKAFVEHGVRVDDPYLLPSDTVAENRDAWVEEWSDLVLR